MSLSVGSILVGLAFGIVVVGYLARPFRPTRGTPDLDRATEVWVTRARSGRDLTPAKASVPHSAGDEPVNFCSKCGRRVGPEDRFCPGCGKSLRGGI